MASRLNYNDLPETIKKNYKSKEIHKISKPTSTLISVHLKNHEKHHYKKKGSDWELSN